MRLNIAIEFKIGDTAEETFDRLRELAVGAVNRAQETVTKELIERFEREGPIAFCRVFRPECDVYQHAMCIFNEIPNDRRSPPDRPKEHV